MVQFKLDESLAISKESDRVFMLDAHAPYLNFDSAFGGWLAAAAAKALIQHPDFRGGIISLNITFIAPVKAKEIVIEIDLIQKRRTTDFWRVVFTDTTTDKILLTVDAAAGIRRPSEVSYNNETIPAHKSLEESLHIAANPMAPKWLAAIDHHLASGAPFQNNGNAHTVVHTRETDGRPADILTAVMMLDTPMPRSFFLREGMSMSSTIALGVFIYATDEDLATIGDDYMLLVTDCAGLQNSLINQEARLFRKDGLLLATGYQTAVYRE